MCMFGRKEDGIPGQKSKTDRNLKVLNTIKGTTSVEERHLDGE